MADGRTALVRQTAQDYGRGEIRWLARKVEALLSLSGLGWAGAATPAGLPGGKASVGATARAKIKAKLGRTWRWV